MKTSNFALWGAKAVYSFANLKSQYVATKTKFCYIVFFIAVMAMSGCNKDEQMPTGSNAYSYTPNLVGLGSWPTATYNEGIWHIYDLNHDGNSEKKFIRVQLYDDDSARILQGPKSIDSLLPNWPADVKKVQWSPGAQFIINDREFISMAGIFQRESYNQVSPQHSWVNNHRAMPSVTELPNGELFWDNSSSSSRLFYFSKAGMGVFQPPLGWQLVPFNSPLVFGQAANAYNWDGVTHYMRVKSSFNSFYFFDFKNWRYWKINQANGLGNDFIAHPVKSLDRFLKWPDGWGKK
jgi:hypothetical protein